MGLKKRIRDRYKHEDLHGSKVPHARRLVRSVQQTTKFLSGYNREGMLRNPKFRKKTADRIRAMRKTSSGRDRIRAVVKGTYQAT